MTTSPTAMKADAQDIAAGPVAGSPVVPRLITLNLIARDIEALGDFYRELFGFAELTERRTAIYRCLDAGGAELGFNAWGAYALLQLQARQPGQGRAEVTAYGTFAADNPAAVDALTGRCLALGGSLVRQATITAYGAYQVVLSDPQQHVFRIQCQAVEAKAGAIGTPTLSPTGVCS